MSATAKDALLDVLEDRRAQVAAGALAAVGAAIVAKRAIGGRGGRERPSRAFRLKRGEGAAEGTRRIATGRAEKAGERLRAAAAGEDAAASLHGARKDLKKLRAVVRLLRAELGERGYRAENARYREAGRLLSASRDAEVKLAALEGLVARADGLAPGAAEEWAAALREERDRLAPGGSGDAVALRDALGLVEEGRDRIAAWRLESDGWDLLGPGLEHAYRRGRRRMRRAAATADAADLHRWRKRVKDLWYQLRVLGPALPERLGGATALADDLAEALGEHHDLVVLRDDLLTRELATVPRARLVDAIAARQEELAATAFALGTELYAEKPKRFRKSLRKGWREWELTS